MHGSHLHQHHQGGHEQGGVHGNHHVHGRRRQGAAHSPFISDGGRRKAAQKGAQSSWDRRATKGASAPLSPSSAPVCLSIQAGEHLSQGDNLTPEGTFEALNSTFVPREEYM